MKKVVNSILIVSALLVLFLLFNPYKKKASVGILLPTDDISAHLDARVGFLTALQNLPKDVNFVDVNYTSDTLERSVEDATKKGIRYFVADGYSSDLAKIDDILERTHSILIETMVTNPKLLKKAKYAFTMAPTDDIQASAIAAYIMNMGYKNIVIVKDNTNLDYVNYLADEIIENLKNTTKEKSVFINEVKNVEHSPDAFVLIMSPDNAVKVIEELKKKFPTSAFIGSDWTFHISLLDHISVAKGFVTVGFVDPIYLESSLNEEISSKYLSLTPVGVLSFNALKVAYVLAKERINYKDAEKYLNSHTFFGMGETFTFNGVHATMPVYFYKITSSGFKQTWKFGGNK